MSLTAKIISNMHHPLAFDHRIYERVSSPLAFQGRNVYIPNEMPFKLMKGFVINCLFILII